MKFQMDRGIYTMVDNRQQSLDELRKAAKIKLEKQKDLENAPGGDIYAEIRDEAESEEYNSYPTLKADSGPEPETVMPYIPIDEDDYQIYDGGPFASQVEIWKKEYGEGHVFHIVVLDRHFVIRTMNRSEYKQLVALENTDALMREEIICSRCVLHPMGYTFKTMATDDAGYPGMVSQIIMEASGFSKDYGIEAL